MEFPREILEYLGVPQGSPPRATTDSDVVVSAEVFAPVFLNALRDQYDASVPGSSPTKTPTSEPRKPSPPSRNSQPPARTARRDVEKSLQSALYEANSKQRPSRTKSKGRKPVQTSIQKLSAPKAEEAAPNVDDLEAFPPIGTTSTAAPPRRITPTPIPIRLSAANENPKQIQFSSVKRQRNSAIFQSSPLKECSNVCLKEEREMLRRARSKLNQSLMEAKQAPPSVQKDNKELDSSKKQEKALADPNKVTEKDKIDAVVDAYVKLIEANLVPNLKSELRFLFQMLTLQVPEPSSGHESTQLLGNVHNCSYFATSVLEKQPILTSILDVPTLHLLGDNPNVQRFSPGFSDKLKRMGQSVPTAPRPNNIPCIEGVSFQSDTDSRENFPTDASFQNARKQRDAFHKLLLDWESNTSPDWTKERDFVKQVQAIMALCTHPANYSHLAHLVQSQMLSTCTRFGELESKDPELLDELKRSHPIKYEKLYERFLVPSQGGATSVPHFQGSQLFFHDFIQVASSPQLNQYLIDSMATKIAELDDPVNISMLLDADDITRKKTFLATTHMLRLLGKFLGLLVFLPYRSNQELPAEFVSKQAAFREATNPLIPVQNYVQRAIDGHHLVLTLPWIVEYLRMMDQITPSLPYYQSVIEELFWIYRNGINVILYPINQYYLRLLLGSLFGSESFPQELFFKRSVWSQSRTMAVRQGLDSMDVIDHGLIYSTCPELMELKILLREFVSGTQQSQKSEVRKITPIRADNIDDSSQLSKNLQQRLEDSFFRNHPASMKRTVIFVAERVTSKVVQHIKRILLPQLKQKAKEAIEKSQLDLTRNWRDVAKDKLLLVIVAKLHASCVESARNQAKYRCQDQVQKVLPLLLPDDTLEPVISMCQTFAIRESLQKVNAWIDSNVTMDYIKSSIKDIVKNLSNVREDLGGNSTEHKPELFTEMTLDFIVKIQQFLADSFTGGIIADECTLDIIDQVLGGHLHDLLHSNATDMQSLSKVLSADLALCLVTWHPNQVSQKLMDAFLDFWKACGDCEPLRNLLSSRNVHLVSLSPWPSKSWSCLEFLVSTLLREGLVSRQCLEEGSRNALKKTWPSKVRDDFTHLIGNVLGS